MKKMGDRLRKFAVSRFGTVRELSKRSEIAESLVYAYVKNARSPSVDSLRKLASVGLNVQWLITGDGPMMVTAGQNVEIVTDADITTPHASIQAGRTRLLQDIQDVLQRYDIQERCNE